MHGGIAILYENVKPRLIFGSLHLYTYVTERRGFTCLYNNIAILP